jgi:hypothetical protein
MERRTRGRSAQESVTLPPRLQRNPRITVGGALEEISGLGHGLVPHVGGERPKLIDPFLPKFEELVADRTRLGGLLSHINGSGWPRSWARSARGCVRW